jgi:zinc protease
MSRIPLAAFAALFLCACSQQHAPAPAEKTNEATAAPGSLPELQMLSRTLPNGMQVYAMRDPAAATVVVETFYRVGSKDDPKGRAGFAHLFEHLMFKATRNLPEGGIERLVNDVGGSFNASTYYDHTNYYTEVPANHLQAALWLEGERLSGLVVDTANFKSERDVVKEELRQRIFAQPYGRILHRLLPQYTYTVHPYGRPMAGTIEDLDAASLEDVRAFHEAYYRPDNAALIVSGNFDQAQLDSWVDQYLGKIERPQAPIQRVVAKEPERQQPAAVQAYAPNLPMPAIIYTFHAPDAADPDTAAMVVLENVLARGRSSRLYDSLVYQQRVASQVSVWNLLTIDGGVFAPTVMVAPGHKVEEAEAALSAEIARLRNEPLSVAELREAKNALLFSELQERETPNGRAFQVGFGWAEANDPQWANKHIAAVQALSAADVQRVAQKYLADHRRVSIRYLDESQRPAGRQDDRPFLDAATVGTIVPPATRPPAALLPENERTAPPQPGAPRSITPPQINERILSNGLRVVVAKSTEMPLVSAAFAVNAGMATDPHDRAGLAEMTARLLARGTAKRSAQQIASEIESLGTTLQTDIQRDGAIVSLSVLRTNVDAAGTVLADMVMNPAFIAEEIARQQREQVDAHAMTMKQVNKAGMRMIDPLMFGDSPYGITSTPTSLAAIAREDVVRHHQTWWRPDNATLVLVGALDANTGFALAERLFGSWQRPAAPLPQTPASTPMARSRVVVVDAPDSGQSAVLALQPAVARSAADYAALSVASSILGGAGGRLYEEIRNKRGLSYGAGTLFDARRDSGLWMSAAQTKNESAAEVAGLMLTQFDRLARETITDEQVRQRVTVLTGAFGREIETTADLASWIAQLELRGVPTAKAMSYPSALAAVTPADVQAAVKRAKLSSEGATILIVGSAKNFLPQLRKQHRDATVIPISQLDLGRPELRQAPAGAGG